MKPTIETGDDMVTVISEPGALTFATRKEWQELPESLYDEIQQFEIYRVFKGTESLFFLLRNMNPVAFTENRGTAYKLVKITSDEAGKQIILAMDLSQVEGVQLRRSRLSMWE